MKKKIAIFGVAVVSVVLFNSCIGAVAQIAQATSQSGINPSSLTSSLGDFKQKIEGVGKILSGELFAKINKYKCIRATADIGIPLVNSQATNLLNKVIVASIDKYKKTENGKDFNMKVCVDDKNCDCKVNETVLFKLSKNILKGEQGIHLKVEDTMGNEYLNTTL
ncbi:MAG: hypothetical protein DSY60_02910 [Persephonella sp.]|nr:MAG: hypothetical protein DSY60_02910 [Persephonella sp.]